MFTTILVCLLFFVLGVTFGFLDGYDKGYTKGEKRIKFIKELNK